MSYGIPFIKTGFHGDTYVYYERLLTDGFPELYSKVKNIYDLRISGGADPQKIADYFKRLRDVELDKELNLLQNAFGRKITKADVLKEQSGRSLIEAFNTCLNLEKVFKRNMALIQKTKGQKQLITWFPTYFEKQWDLERDDIAEDIKREFSKNSLDLNIVISNVLQQYIPRMVRNALIYMFKDADVENGIKNKTTGLQDAYAELLPALQNVNDANGNQFINSFIETYRLNDLITAIQNNMARSQGVAHDMESMGFKVASSIHVKGGLALENLENFAVNYIAENIEGKNIHAYHTGTTNQKANNIITVDIPFDAVNNWLEHNAFGTRAKDTEAIQRLQDQLEQFGNGFIIYTSAKNYTLNSDFRGYSAGEPISLKNFQQAAKNLDINAKDLVGSIMQIIPGAIYDDREEEVKLMVIRAIAAALFDDFNEVGRKTEYSGPRSIHLLDLNGILIPVSWFFNIIAEAFSDFANDNINNVVRVLIKKPNEIEFPTQSDQRAWEAAHPDDSAWAYQAQIAQNEITIQYYFLRKFKELMENLGEF